MKRGGARKLARMEFVEDGKPSRPELEVKFWPRAGCREKERGA